MCPLCIASAALIAAGTGSAGGLTVLLMKKLKGKSRPEALQDVRPGKRPH